MKYKTIVIDPPWKLATFNSKPFSHAFGPLEGAPPYKMLSDKEIIDFPIEQFADAECDLFLWTVKSKIHLAFHIMEKWGFHYANFLVWNKLHRLNHNGVSATCEFILYGYKGRNGLDYANPMPSYFEERLKKHSQKPDVFYAEVAKITKEPRVDLFARRRHYGFDAWGNQVETQMEMPILLFNSEKVTNK
jgi:N6-adenosine-specific RNA methylase IME4